MCNLLLSINIDCIFVSLKYLISCLDPLRRDLLGRGLPETFLDRALALGINTGIFFLSPLDDSETTGL